MSDLSPSAFLVRSCRRFPVFDTTAKRVDLVALGHVAKLLPSASGLTEPQRVRLVRVVERIQKGVVAFGDAAAGGRLDERFGFPILVEVPEGGQRSGVGPDGAAWTSTMVGCSYGMLPDTVGLDDEPVDIFVGPDPSAELVWIVEQLTKAGEIDEHKLLVGWTNAKAAIETYQANVPPWCFGALYAMPLALLRGLLQIETDAPGMVAKMLATSAAAGAGVAVISNTSTAMIGGVVKVDEGELGQRAELVAEMVGYFSGPDTEAVEPTDHRCPLCGQAWTPDDVRTYSLMPLDAATKISLFYRTHRTCAEAAGDAAIFALDDQALEHGAAGRVGPDAVKMVKHVRKSFDGTTPISAIPATTRTTKGELMSFAVRLLPVAKDARAYERRLVYGVVLEPEPRDGAGDAHDETYDDGVIEQAAHDFLMWTPNLNLEHGPFLNGEARIAECYVAPCDFILEGSPIRLGAWVLVTKIFDDTLWNRVLSGEITSYSIEGYAERVPNV
jgi:hypothetical protein